MRMKTVVLLAALILLVPAVPAVAEGGGNVAEIHIQTPKPGMGPKYQAGRKKHMGWHKRQKDDWSWTTYEIVTGDRTGSFLTGTFGHDWKDFDAREKMNVADGADAEKTMGAAVASESMSYWTVRADLDLAPPVAGPPAKYLVVQHFFVKPEAVGEFVAGVKKIRDAIKKTNWPQKGASRWFQLGNGGAGPHYVLASDRADYASMAPPEKPMDAMLEEAYGKEEGAAVMAATRKTFVSLSSELLQHRPDLSYAAPK